MDTIWERNPFKSDVICCCGTNEKNQLMSMQNYQSQAPKNNTKKQTITEI